MATPKDSSTYDDTTMALLGTEPADTIDSHHFIDTIQAKKGLPDGIDTEPHLWDEILKKEFMEFPTLFLPLIRETHGKIYPPDISIEPAGTEYSVERVVTKELTSIRSDTMIKVNHSDAFHFESQRYSDPEMVYRMFEYDSQYTLSSKRKVLKSNKNNPAVHTGRGTLKFPYSAILLLEGGKTLRNHLTCRLQLPKAFSTDFSRVNASSEQNANTDLQTIDYSVAIIKVQEYDVSDIREKKLYVLIPYMPIRFNTLARAKSNDNTDGNNTGKTEIFTISH